MATIQDMILLALECGADASDDCAKHPGEDAARMLQLSEEQREMHALISRRGFADVVSTLACAVEEAIAIHEGDRDLDDPAALRQLRAISDALFTAHGVVIARKAG